MENWRSVIWVLILLASVKESQKEGSICSTSLAHGKEALILVDAEMTDFVSGFFKIIINLLLKKSLLN